MVSLLWRRPAAADVRRRLQSHAARNGRIRSHFNELDACHDQKPRAQWRTSAPEDAGM